MLMNIEDKIAVIRAAVLTYKPKHTFVEIDDGSVDCIYDYYNIVITSTPETVILKILKYSRPLPAIHHLSLVWLYIGFFCEMSFDSLLGKKVSNCYYKLAIESGNTLACIYLGNQYFNMNKLDKALGYYELAIKNSHPDQETTFYKIANVYSHKKDYVNSLKYYKMQADVSHERFRLGVVITSSLGNIYNNILMAYLKLGKYAETVEYLEMVAQKNENNNFGIAHFCKAWSNEKFGNKDIAIRFYGLALINNFANPWEIYNELASLYRRKGELAVALKYLKKLFKNGQYNTAREICTIYSVMGDNLRSLKYFKKCITHSILNDFSKSRIKKMFLQHKNYDCLVHFYVNEKDSIKILELLITIDTISMTTVSIVGNYFSTNINNNCLHTFIHDIVRPKINLLETHFKYAINSDFYNEAEIDFYNIVEKQ